MEEHFDPEKENKRNFGKGEKMTLYEYLKQFDNICWYPSAGKDSLSMLCLSKKSLEDYGISSKEAPDCYLFTDYRTYAEYENSHRFFLDASKFEEGAVFDSRNSDLISRAFNVKELNKLTLPFDENMVDFERDQYYGRVFVADALVEHPSVGKSISKLIYVIAENTSFALNFLIKKKIKVKYVIHSNYGHGFGGGRSNGNFICNILKDFGTKYFISDIDEHHDQDLADIYLTKEQKNRLPVLKQIDNFYRKFKWYGYDETVFYEVIGYKEIEPYGYCNKRFLKYYPGMDIDF